MLKPFVHSFILTLVLASFAEAQVTDQVRQRRREFIGNLLESLIESQLEPNQGRAQVRPGNVPPNRQGLPVAGTRQMQELRQGLTNFSIQIEGLVGSLQRAQYQSPQARVLLADAMQVQALSNSLMRQANFTPDHRDIIDGYRQLDQAWRSLVYRVRNSPGLDRGCVQFVDQMQVFGDQMGTCLNVQPTLNRAELVRLMSAMNLSFQHLLQDLYYDNRNEPRIEAAVRDGQELLSKINQASSCIDREPYDRLIDIYRDMSKHWRRYVRKIRPFQSERVRHDIQEIESIGLAIQEQLRLPNQLDTEYILDVTRAIEADVARLFGTITLQDMMGCENPNLVLNAAREFQRSCGTFSGSLQNGLESWMWDYQLFNVQWQTLKNQCQRIESAKVTRRLREIEDAMLGLTQHMGQGPIISRHDLIQMSAQLDQYMTDLQYAMRRDVFQHQGYDRAF